MSADNFLAVVKEDKRKWAGYSCCASHSYPFTDCFPCIGGKEFETTTELRALHEAQRVEKELQDEGLYLEYGYTFVGQHWLTPKEKQTICPCKTKRSFTEVRGVKSI